MKKKKIKKSTEIKKETEKNKEDSNKTALKITNLYLKSLAENWQQIFTYETININNEEEFLNKNIFDDATIRINYIRWNLLKTYSTYDFNKVVQVHTYVKYDTFKEQFENTFSDKYTMSETLKNVNDAVLSNEDTYVFGDDANKYVSWNTTGTASPPIAIEFEINSFELKNDEYIVTGTYYYHDWEVDNPDKQYNFSLKLTNSDDNYRIKELVFTK